LKRNIDLDRYGKDNKNPNEKADLGQRKTNLSKTNAPYSTHYSF